jgi:cell wall-associated NlpC family hydrolase
MNTKYKILIVILIVTEKASLSDPESIISNIKTAYAPDKRVALFDVEAVKLNENLVLKGESNLPKAVSALKDSLSKQGVAFVDSITLLPAAELDGKIFGVINLSVANIRSQPQHSAELATQALMGTPLNVLKKERGWYLVQTPDQYIAWLDWGGLQLMTDKEFKDWKATEKLIYTKPFGFSYKNAKADSSTISDLVLGDILEISGQQEGFFEVKYADGTVAYVPEEDGTLYEDWLEKLIPSETSLVNTSFLFKGLPYLWGGTSFKGVDCSGFTKTVYFMNGLIIPRDASQQIHTGELVDDRRDFAQLLPGDLLFFGRPATASASERVIHVGIWIGDNEFIHASGNVHVSSMDSTAENFDDYNYERYLRSKRLLNQKDERLIQLKESDVF